MLTVTDCRLQLNGKQILIRSSRRSNAITNKIKTYFTSYIGEITSGSGAISLLPRRVSDNSVAGTAEEITSDIILPDSRIPSTPEVGTESNAGDVATEWNVDGEQDDLFAGAFCGEWTSPVGGVSSLTLGDAVKSFLMVKKYPQTPLAWQMYTKMYVNQLTMDFATDAFVKLTWNLMGSNNPKKVFTEPSSYDGRTLTYGSAKTGKSFLTKKGWLKYGDTVSSLVAVRQSPSMNITINNNLERTPALFEEESIENSLGDFVIEGSFDVYNVDDLGHQIYNDAVDGKDKVLQVRVERKVNGLNTAYTLTLNVHLGAPTESKNGNKLQFSVPFKVNASTDLKLEKSTVVEDAETPSFSNVIANATYEVDASSVTALNGTATVSDGGTLSYQWYSKAHSASSWTEIEGADEATYTPSVETAGVTDYKVVATNTNSSATTTTTATAQQICTITVTA